VNQSVLKAITLLRQTAAHPEGASVSALARDVGIPRATALRLIQTMESEGLLVRVPERDRVLLGPELVRLARHADMGTILHELAGVHLGVLAAAVEETVTLSVIAQDGDLDVVQQISGPQHLVPRSWLGRRFPLHASSSGKLLLASSDRARRDRLLPRRLPALTPHTITAKKALDRELEHVRADGFASTVDELEEGLSGISVGIHGADGAFLGSVNVSGLSQRFRSTARRRAVEHARDAAREIEAALHANTELR
jgi:DNA-binding IclR family transcriptional regulator